MMQGTFAPLCLGVLLLAGSLGGAAANAQPVAYAEHEVRFESGEAELAGTLFMPVTGASVPAVIVTHGSGREGRKLAGYRWIGATLAREGFAVLIYDKRGVGDSEGTYVETPDLRVPARDVVAAAAFLKTRARIDAGRIGVLGASQGGWVGPLAATLTDDLAFVVSLNGPGVSVREQVLYQRGVELRAQGLSEETVETILAFARRLYTYLGTGDGYEALRPAYEAAAAQPWFAFFNAQGFTATLPPPASLDRPTFDFFRNITYDPAPTLEQLAVPILAVFGADDQQVPTQASVRAMEQAFAQSGHQDATIHVLPGEGHNLWRRVDGSPEMRPAFRSVLLAWLRKFK